MKIVTGVLACFLLFCGDAQAHDAFDAIKCGSDISKTLIGKTMPGGAVVVIEAGHRDIGLKDLGTDEILEHLQLVEWQICGSDYNILVDQHDRMRDVLKFPPHSRATPEFGGICQIDGENSEQTIDALLDNKASYDANIGHHYAPSDRTYLPALAAWQIDEKSAKFTKVSVRGLRCPRSGINTLDGGP